jgi:peptidoglycan hydrolase-like protein with peptidoglycan-binding domain
MSEVTIPEEFVDPEGDGEIQDPELGFETTTSRLRSLWAPWMCRQGSGRFANPSFFGKGIGGVPAPAVDAFRALEATLRATGYEAQSRWAYNCRMIASSNKPSLHSAGIAVDIDPKDNPYTTGDPFSGKLTREQVAAVLAIKNSKGRSVWSWGGNWRKPDRMHFQLDQGPDAVDVDWSTVPGGAVLAAASGMAPAESRPTDEEGNVLRNGASGKAVEFFQARLLAWNEEALPEWGADGDFGDETTEWVRKFQTAAGLEATGVVDGVTAALLHAGLRT